MGVERFTLEKRAGITVMALWVIMVIAAILRFRGLSFGLPAVNDPDELMFQMGAIRMLSEPTLNPGWFGHPATTTIYLLAITHIVVFLGGWGLGFFPDLQGFAEKIYQDPTLIMLPGRIGMVVFALLSIWLTYRLGRDLFNRRVGLVAAFLLAINPLHIAYSQVIRSDIMAICFMLLCFHAIWRVAKGGGGRDLFFGSLWLALAVITKWPFALTGLAIIGVGGLLWWQGEETFTQAVRRTVIFGFGAIFLIFCLSPYLLLDYQQVVQNLQGEMQIRHLGATGGTVFQNLAWYSTGPLYSSFGLLACLCMIVGACLMARHRLALMMLAPVMLGFLITLATQTLIWERWLLPLLPILAFMAALGFDQLLRVVSRQKLSWDAMIGAMLLALIAVVPVTETVKKTNERIHDTRQIATHWARDHIPAGSYILVEHFGFDMLPQPWDFLFPMGDAGCVNARAMLEGKIAYSEIGDARGGRSNVDYGTVNPAKRGNCQSDYAILTQYDRYLDEKSDFPEEYEAYRQLLAGAEIVATFRPKAGEIGGPIVRVVKF